MAIFGIKRKDVPKLRAKRAKETLQERRAEAQAKRKQAEMKRKQDKLLAEGAVYEAKARKKQAKREAGFQWPILPTKKVKIRKKKQGKKLSSKSRIKLI